MVVAALFFSDCYYSHSTLWRQEWLAESQLLSTKRRSMFGVTLSLVDVFWFKDRINFAQIARQAYRLQVCPRVPCGIPICTDLQILTRRERWYRCCVSNKVFWSSPAFFREVREHTINQRSKQRINQRTKLVFIELETIKGLSVNFSFLDFRIGKCLKTSIPCSSWCLRCWDLKETWIRVLLHASQHKPIWARWILSAKFGRWL